MFQLRSCHIDAFARVAHDAMVERIAAALCVLHPEAKEIAADEFLAEIDRQCERAGSYGLSAEADVTVYVDCAWRLGPDFDRDFPVIRGILREAQTPPKNKAHMIAEHTRRIFMLLREEG